jgi:arginyl-tRNA synthetase
MAAVDELMTPQTMLAARVAQAAAKAAGLGGVDPLVTPAGNPEHGDFQCNCAMGLAGRIKKERGEKTNPRELAGKIVEALDADDLLAEKPTVAGPGFINFRLSDDFLMRQATAVAQDERLGVAKAATPETVVVEYSSPNIAKQMHVGHIRSTILGDAAARVLEHLGHDVIRQNHVGDWGTQFGMLIGYLVHHDLPVPDDLPGLEKAYQASKKWFDADPAHQDTARSHVVELQAKQEPLFSLWQLLIKVSREHYQGIYDRLGVSLGEADERGESFYNPRLPSLVEDLLEAGVVEESEGAVVSFAGGGKTPLMVRKSDGGFCYGTTDLAACEFRGRADKLDVYGRAGLAADRVIYLVDARQALHFSQVFATAQAAAARLPAWERLASVTFEHASFGSVLGEGGTPLKTRDGGTIKLADLLDEAETRARKLVDELSPNLPEAEKDELGRSVGIGAVKYADLSKDRSSDYVFSFDEMLRLDGNSGPYMQYAHARVRSVLRKAAEAGAEMGDISTLTTTQERTLAKRLLAYPDVVAAVGRDLRPHVLCAYLYDLAREFSGFYEHCPILKAEGDERASRLALAKLTGRTLAAGLDLLGIAHPDRM